MIEGRTNDEAVEAFWIYGLGYEDVGLFELHQLMLFLEREIAGCDDPAAISTMRVDPVVDVELSHDGSIRSAQISCSSHYFEGRDLVTFHNEVEHRRIQLAGWTDSHNAKPVRDGFVRWVGWLAALRLDHARSLFERIREVA